MKYFILGLFYLLFVFNISEAQIVQSKLKTSPLHASIDLSNIKKNPWNTNLKTTIDKPKSGLGNIHKVKRRNRLLKLNNQSFTAPSLNKTLGAAPTIGQSFQGNDLTSLTPADNTVAINDSGIIVSLNNYSYAVYDSSGNTLTAPITWNTFLGDDSVALIRGKFDPRIEYDPYHKRFVFCILHAPVDSTHTSIILAFSKTNNPTQGWHVYNIGGNPLLNSSWTDYPSIGLTEYELFINANLFGLPPTYGYNGTYIHQIDLDSAYAGGTLQYRTWSGFDPNKFITLKPAQDGLHEPNGDRFMNFVMLNPGEDTLVHRFIISDTMNATGVTITDTSYKIPYYSACANGFIKGTSTNADSVNNFIDSISTGDSRIQNAFLLDSFIHFTFSANVSGYCGIHYGRVNLRNHTASYVTYSESGTELSYPAIASTGRNNTDKNIVMAYLRADTNILPEFCVIAIDDNMVFSSAQTIKTGDTIVNILTGRPERWGDYTGIARKYNSSAAPEVWVYGCYAGNSDSSYANAARKNSYKNWIAQIKSNEGPVTVLNTKKKRNVTLYPNPARSTYFLDFELDKVSHVRIALYDINGRKIKTLFNGELPASKNEFSFNRNALSNGQYFIQLNVDGTQSLKKLVLVE